MYYFGEETGGMAISTKALKMLKYIGIGFAAGIANGLFGSGGGTIAVPAMVFLLEEDEHRAHATALLIILPLTMVSAYFYLSNSYLDWGLTWKAMVGGVIGGSIGAFLLNKCPAGVLRKIFGAFMIIAAIRMIF
jgi:uncharacterized membrane protein YfcA